MGCAGLLVIAAFTAVPAAASAKTELVQGGTAIPLGTTIHGANVGNVVFATSQGNFECQHAELNSEVMRNGPRVELSASSFTITGNEAGGKCGWAGNATAVTVDNLPWCISSTAVLNGWASVRSNCTEGSTGPLGISFKNLWGTCHYTKASLNFSGTESAELTTNASQTFSKSEGSAFCPGSFTLQASFKFTANGSGITVKN
jgi:hypothetical protein